ncbi:MAG: hypothetical protein HY903_00685 [Deltaproteobacteria bacterium]|nr:hypothetical protein [Deltaproteobacteria bacterium]
MATAASGKLGARIVPRAGLSASERLEMWRLFCRFYDDVTRAQFDLDLDAKDDVILLLSGDGVLQGFSTLARYSLAACGRRYQIVFSGDTIVDPRYWGQTALQLAFYRYVLATKLRCPWRPLYWFLITKGYRTYLLLSRNFLEYWPRHDRPTPPEVGALLAAVAGGRFPAAWRPALGILRFAAARGRLKESVAPITPELLRHADIRFFVAKNPGHAAGDELCCLGRIDLRFALAYAAKQLGRLATRLWRRRRSWLSTPSSSTPSTPPIS